MEVTPQDVLVRAYDLLTEYGISREAYARDGNGQSCATTWEHVQSFCSVGAISRATFDLMGKFNHELAIASEVLLREEAGIVGITRWNDYVATDEEILATFRKAAGLPEPSKPVEALTEASESVLVAA